MHLPLGRSPQHELGESPRREPARRLDRERVGHRSLAPTVVMTEGLTVGSDADDAAIARVGEEMLGGSTNAALDSEPNPNATSWESPPS